MNNQIAKLPPSDPPLAGGRAIHERDTRQRDVAQYIADMILELRNMAKSADLARVLVPLEFAYYEAFTAANRVTVPPEEVERLKRISEAARQTEKTESGN